MFDFLFADDFPLSQLFYLLINLTHLRNYNPNSQLFILKSTADYHTTLLSFILDAYEQMQDGAEELSGSIDDNIGSGKLIQKIIQSIHNSNMSNTKGKAGYLVILEPADIAGKIPFYYGENIIGRASGKATLIIKEISISSRHAKLIVTPQRITITDIGSKNGIKINSSESFILCDREIEIDESMIIYIADVKCQIEKEMPKELVRQIETKQQVSKQNSRRAEVMALFQEDISEKIQGKHTVKNEFVKPNIEDDFDIESGFNNKPKKQEENNKKSKAQKKKEIKLPQKSIEIAAKQKQESMPKQKQPKMQQINEAKDKKSKNDNKKKNQQKQLDKGQKKKEVKQSNHSLEEPSKQLPQRKQHKSLKQKDNLLKSYENPHRKSQRLSNEQNSKEVSKQKKENSKKIEKTSKQQEKKSSKDKQPKKQAKSKNPPRAASEQPALKKQDAIAINVMKPPNHKNRKNDIKISREECETIISMEHSATTKKKSVSRKRKPSQSIERQIGIISSRRSFLNRRILISGFLPEFNRNYFLVVDNVKQEFDYLVMREYKRTFKALISICRGKPIVRYEWITDSEFVEKTMKPQFYLFRDYDYIYDAIDSAKKGNLVFKGYEISLISEQYHLKIEEIEMIVNEAGGIMKMLNKSETKVKQVGKKIAIVRNKNEKIAKLFESEVLAAKKLGYTKIYTIEFLLDSCERQIIDWKANNACEL